MSSKKIKLTSSANAINARVAVAAGKKKALPKLKVILANPYKPKKEMLSESEMSEFKEMLKTEIASTGVSGRQFARRNNIHLGLGSSLRAIGTKSASCVLISQTIKPKFIIDQIGYFAKQKDNTLPVYIIEDCDKISQELFGVKALVVAFSKNLSGKPGKWISERTLPVKAVRNSIKNTESNQAILTPKKDVKLDLNSIYLTKTSKNKRSFVPDIVVKPQQVPINQSKDWTGDYISFSNPNESTEEMDIDEVDDEFRRKQDKALEALQRIAKSAQKDRTESEPKGKSNPKQENSTESICIKKANVVTEEWESDAFSKSYIGLEVHKIQPNPNRKQKNKRKNKNKNKNKIKNA